MPFYTRKLVSLAALTLIGCGGGGDLSLHRGVSSLPNPGPASPEEYRLPWPCGEDFVVTQGNDGDECGIRGNHTGIEKYAWDFGLPMRTPVLAARAGVVTLAETPSPPGSSCYKGCPGPGGADLEQQACCRICLYSANKINVQHEDGIISSYSHLDEVVVRAGQRVAAGELLGYSGTTGCSTGPHLHFQIMKGCPHGYCQSLPLQFGGAGVPACGDHPVSWNDCQ